MFTRKFERSLWREYIYTYIYMYIYVQKSGHPKSTLVIRMLDDKAHLTDCSY